jgi:hypothetical protein
MTHKTLARNLRRLVDDLMHVPIAPYEALDDAELARLRPALEYAAPSLLGLDNFLDELPRLVVLLERAGMVVDPRDLLHTDCPVGRTMRAALADTPCPPALTRLLAHCAVVRYRGTPSKGWLRGAGALLATGEGIDDAVRRLLESVPRVGPCGPGDPVMVFGHDRATLMLRGLAWCTVPLGPDAAPWTGPALHAMARHTAAVEPGEDEPRSVSLAVTAVNVLGRLGDRAALERVGADVREPVVLAAVERVLARVPVEG